ncbi:MAG: hypothetical protein COU46_00615 [Candidatus Niyogibacteria bacterium CG10_big_fil_rev_8_21_14_0_10_42_19]|uniref:LiaI-LiaF-like transmembrane region domain-containing protein n=1 Tax=Candidatus Niyogibacteria bacterium CG10_big_fil_rev_8_21_14_0_10_42_19 TaxID=1974725 RepID=A0A2H0TGD1_9BACT|nr:MAG: hypothetical protein COU46_00615 [Candidatus Niyogibacteria bacterium CG10_big_fil_rev_8_21_14_0_10_42_19]
MVIGSFLIMIGGVFLLKNLGVISGAAWGAIWPLILVVMGIYFVQKARHIHIWREKIWRKLD